MELELNKAEIYLLLQSIDVTLENYDDHDDDDIRLAIGIKKKLQEAFYELAEVD